MSYCFVPSLQSMAATKIVTVLWNRGDVIALIAEWDEDYRGVCWRKIERKVNEKVSLLRLPAPLLEKLSSVVIPIGDQIRRWKATHFQNYRFKNMPREFCWTSRGTMEKKKTAEVFVRDPSIPEGERYCMACLYCIEWDDPVPFQGTESYDALSHFRAYWTYDTTGDATALLGDTSKTPHQWAFDCAVGWRNEVAAEYYLRKLTPEEREESLSDVELDLYFADFDFYRFLLLQMNERQRSRLHEKLAEHVLESLSAWPWQPFFMDFARRVKDILDSHQYSSLLSKIVRKIRDGYNDYSYRELFGAFWVEIPVDHKKEVMRDCLLLGELFRGIGAKNISFMLKEVSPEEREQILFSDEGILICESLADDDEWDALEFFISECITTCEKMIHFKEECEKSGNVYFNRFFQILDDLIEKCGEKSGREEMDCSVPKRL